ncbi:PDZ domain-containing protein [Dyella sp. C9]|uniref:PDZ domain-containing protein n=1 Tax=Dyella sp. C9 TaxID=2202154 RepID=UPI000DEFB34F|nr:PDZ domain-containing protein [Dyella sp. C9]
MSFPWPSRRTPKTVAGAVFGLCVVTLSTCSVASDVSIPFRFEDLRVYVDATSGAQRGECVLDTGADDVMIDTAAAGALGMRATSVHAEHGAGRGSMATGNGGGVSMTVGGVPLEVESADVAPINRVLRPYNGLDIKGVIGAPFFMAHVVEIDFTTRALVLHDPSIFAYHGQGARLPFQFVDGDPVVQGELALADGARLPLRLLIDLGAKADLLVAEPFVREHRLLARVGPTVVEPLGAGVGGETRYAFTRLAGLKVGNGVEGTDLIAGLSVNGTLRGGGYDALLGAGFLQRYRVIVDYPHRTIVLEPREPAPVEGFDRSGAFLVANGEGLQNIVVHEVVAGSPADRAGVRKGDVIEAVDGRDVRDLRIWGARKALSVSGDTVVVLTLRRHGRDLSAAIRLRDLI